MAADTPPGGPPAEPPAPPVVLSRRTDYPGPVLRTAADYGWRLLVLGAVVYFAVRLLSHLGLVVIPFLVSLLATALLREPLNFLQRRGFRRGVATVVTVIGAAVVLGGAVDPGRSSAPPTRPRSSATRSTSSSPTSSGG